MGRTVGVTLERNGGHGDHRTFGESFLELVATRIGLMIERAELYERQREVEREQAQMAARQEVCEHECNRKSDECKELPGGLRPGIAECSLACRLRKFRRQNVHSNRTVRHHGPNRLAAGFRRRSGTGEQRR